MNTNKGIILPFDLPAPEGHSVAPKWNGRNFVFSDQSTPVLEYSENFSGWSNNLSALHQKAMGYSHPIDLASRRDALAQVKKFIPFDKAIIMEIGCSSGFLIQDLVKNFPKAVIIGADVVKEPLYRFAENFPGIPLIHFDLLRCPLPDQSIDVLVMLNVLEHIEDDVRALQKAFNLLKPGGVLIIEVPASPGLYDAYDREMHHFRRYSVGDLNSKLITAGFKVCRKSHLGFVLFPVFTTVKLLKKLLSSKRNKKVVREQVSSTSGNNFVKLALEFESKHLSNFQLPYGIRVLAVAKKSDRDERRQTLESVDKNAKFFLDEHQNYRALVESIDTYAAISLALNIKLQGIGRLLDIGNGGVFDYDTSHIGEIVGLDLFFDNLPSNIRLPKNVKMVQGSALDIPKNLYGFDGVVVVMMIHHLVGKTVNDCIANTQQLLYEAHRVLRPGGKLVIMESCIPSWFFAFEKIVFEPATWVIEKTISHPSTLQYTSGFLLEMIKKAGFTQTTRENIPKGKYVIQYGVKVPSWVTPVQPVLFSAVRP